MKQLIGKTSMATETRLNITPQLILGSLMIVFGVLLTLDRMELVDAARTLRFWPVVLIALGSWIVIERGTAGRSFPGYAMIIIGSLLLLNSLGFARVRFWELFWPAIIVLVGARLIMHTPGLKRERHRLRSSVDGEAGPWLASTSGDGTINMFALLGSDKRASGDKIFSGAEVTSILSGTHLDLRQAVIEPGHEAVINIFIMLGGHEVWIPQGWTVVIEVMPILGGVDDKRLPAVLTPAAGSATGAAPRLVLRGTVLLGGLEIKN
jgi:predicted membrane protein